MNEKAVMEVCRKITEAANPEEIFGSLGGKGQNRGDKLKALEREFNKFKQVLAIDLPSVSQALLEKVDETRVVLDDLYEWARTIVVGEDLSERESVEDSEETESRPAGLFKEITMKITTTSKTLSGNSRLH